MTKLTPEMKTLASAYTLLEQSLKSAEAEVKALRELVKGAECSVRADILATRNVIDVMPELKKEQSINNHIERMTQWLRDYEAVKQNKGKE